MNRGSRNDPCHCGSGKKYKKCCLATDAARVTQLDAAVVDVYRPAALPITNNRFVPAIACLKENDKDKEQDKQTDDECLFVLVRASRPLDELAAIDEAGFDLDSLPDAADGVVGPGCLRYLDKIGYRTMPGIGLDSLKFFSEEESEGEICEYCGHVHPVDDDSFDNEEKHYREFDDEEIETNSAGMVEFIQRLASIPIEKLNTLEVADTLVRLCESGFTREEALVMVLETMMEEVKRVTESGGSEPDVTHFASALARLPEGSTE